MNYFERLKRRARRANCWQREVMWQRYMTRILRGRHETLGVWPWIQFETHGSMCLVRVNGVVQVLGQTGSVSGWEMCAEKLRRRLKTFKTAPSGREHPLKKEMPGSRPGRPLAAVEL